MIDKAVYLKNGNIEVTKSNGNVTTYNPNKGATIPVKREVEEWLSEGNEVAPYDNSNELEDWRKIASVPSLQAKAALYQAGLLEDAEALVTAEGGLMALAWNSANTWERKQPFINQLADALSLSAEEVDDLFVKAGEGLV